MPAKKKPTKKPRAVKKKTRRPAKKSKTPATPKGCHIAGCDITERHYHRPRQSPNEEEAKRIIREMKRNPPESHQKLRRQIDDLVLQPWALEVFRNHIRNVVKELEKDRLLREKDRLLREKEGKDPGMHTSSDFKDFFGRGAVLTDSEKFYLLAAFHDVSPEVESMPPIMDKSAWGGDYAKGYWKWYDGDGDECATYLDERRAAMLQRYIEQVKAALAVSAALPRLTPCARAVLDYLKKCGGEPRKHGVICNQVVNSETGENYSRGSVTEALKRLRERGCVGHVEPRGGYYYVKD